MILDPDTVAVVALAAAVVAATALLVATVTLGRLARLRAEQATLRAAHAELRTAYDGLHTGEGQPLLDAVREQTARMTELQTEAGWAQQAVAALRAEMSASVRHVSVVRYDALEDLGGRLSFSAALVDDSGTGLIVSAINGRSETRTYAKAVVDGRSDHDLSPEELEALAAARGGGRAGAGPSGEPEHRSASVLAGVGSDGDHHQGRDGGTAHRFVGRTPPAPVSARSSWSRRLRSR